MAIDGLDVRLSPAWWLDRLVKRLIDKDRIERFDLLSSYVEGRAPLPQGSDGWRPAFAHVQRLARTNFAELITDATRERMRPYGFRTAADSDATGDAVVWDLWRRAGMDVIATDALDGMLQLSEHYLVIGDVDEDTKAPLVTVEDPRECIVETDPARGDARRAALKLFHDDVDERDYAYLWLPGFLYVARSPERHGATRHDVQFSAQSWTWDAERSMDLRARIGNRIPVIPFRNRRGLGEYEPHLDVLDRINHVQLERMVIGLFQAYRQRAAIGLPLYYPDDHEKAGELIPYHEIFTAHPGAMWQMPEDVKMWESQATDLTPVLSGERADIEHLAAVTRTPMHMFLAEGENQTAEGAALAREGLCFKVREHTTRCSSPMNEVASFMLRWVGETDRADLGAMQVLWQPPEMYSLSERADAATKLGASTVGYPWRSLMIDILGVTPADVDRMEIERAQQQAADIALAAAQAAAIQPVQAPQQPDDNQPDDGAGSGADAG